MEEISLKEILQILIKGKLKIAIITAIALAIGTVYYTLAPNIYTTSVSLLANPIINESQTNDYINKLILPTMDINSYKEQFLNSYTLSKTILELELKDDKGDYVTQSSLESKLTVDNPTNTNILQLTVSETDPELTAKIANSISNHFVNYITEIYQSSASAAARSIAEQLKIEQENLDNEASRLRDYLTRSTNIDALKSEINDLIYQITLYKSQANDLEQYIAADKMTLEYMNQVTDISSINTQNIDISKNISTGEHSIYLNSIDVSSLEKSLLTLSITDITTRFIENTNAISVLRPKIEFLESRLSELQAKQAEEEYKYNAVLRDYNMAESIYETYTAQYRQALIIETSNMGTVNVQILADADIPVSASNKNLMLIVSVSLVLGLFVGIFIVLFNNYWAEDSSVSIIRK